MPEKAIKGSKGLDNAITSFVRESLGCECPDEVFETIEYQLREGPDEGLNVTIGGRLLVWVRPFMPRTGHIGQRDVPHIVYVLLQSGRDERDTKGLNRFRLVLVASKKVIKDLDLRANMDRGLEMFTNDIGRDEKVHVHLIEPGGLPGPIKELMM
jgi:hypothetical protein